ncbi:MAG: response regulator [Desulfobulbaceae bacterium]|nr:response regulator [Desulfobulbaceae bacterium]
MRNSSVLIVDDHKGMLQTLNDILTLEGCLVSLADSGRTAIELCQKQKFDLILMDVRMPEIDGVETLKRLKKYVKNTRVIMMSAYAMDELKHRAFSEGVVAFLGKPIDVEEVIGIIRQIDQPSILLVMKNSGEQKILEKYLDQYGYRAYSAEESEDLIELAEQIYFSIIIVDTGATTNGGLEMHQELKRASPKSLLILLDNNDTGCDAIAKTDDDAVIHNSSDIAKLLSVLKRHKQQYNG